MNLIKEKRLERGMTQTELAKAIGVNQSQIARYESGKRIPKPAMAQRIAPVLCISWTDIYKEDSDGDGQTEAPEGS